MSSIFFFRSSDLTHPPLRRCAKLAAEKRAVEVASMDGEIYREVSASLLGVIFLHLESVTKVVLLMSY